MSFLSAIVTRNRLRLQDWLSEQFEFFLQMSSLVIAFGVFKGLRVLNLEAWLVDWLEKLDECAVILVFALFLMRVVRQAAALVMDGRANVHR